MTNVFELNAEARESTGRGASRRLRRKADAVPVIVYGGGVAPASLQIPHKDIIKALQNEAFYSHILTLNLSGKPMKVVLKDIQRHPYKPRVLHMDFQRVTGKEKIHMHVPLHFINEQTSPGVKDGGVVSHYFKDVEVVCMPDNLPEFIEVDLGNLNVGDVVHLKQVKIPKGVEFTLLSHGEDPAIAAIHMPRVVEEEEVAAPEAVEGEAVEGEAAEGETAAKPSEAPAAE